MATELSYSQIMTELRAGKYRPIYYLMGEESYFIDSISDYIENNAIPEDQRDFNQMVVYALDTNIGAVLSQARAFPMMGDRQLIIVKEAQNMAKEKDMADMLMQYLAVPQEKTILVFCHKHGSLDKRKKVYSQIVKCGAVVDAKPLKESDVQSFIADYVKERGGQIDSKSCSMLVEYVGSDLSRVVSETDKLLTSFPAGAHKQITPDVVQRNVGISKDYNVFEFRDALVRKDVFKANQIAVYYENNAKTYPLQMVLAVIFQYYANLMLAYYAPEKSENGVAAQLGLKNTWGVRDYMTGMKNYTAVHVLEIISEIRTTLAKAQGVDATSGSTDGLLRELVFKILH